MMKNVIAYFSQPTETKVLVFDDESITIQLSSQWPQYNLLYSILQICDHKINFFSINKDKNVSREISITSSTKLITRVLT